jgi:hypothetical protein
LDRVAWSDQIIGEVIVGCALIGDFAFERGRGVQTALAADCSTAFCAARLVA